MEKNQDIMGTMPSDCHVFKQGGNAVFAVSQLSGAELILFIHCSLTGCTSHTLLCVQSLQAALELKGFCVCWPLPLRQDSVFTAHLQQINISPPLKAARAGDSRSLGSLFPCLANNLIG